MSLNILIVTFVIVLVILVIGLVSLAMRQRKAEQKVRIAEETAKRMLEDAHKEAERTKKEALLEAKDITIRTRAEFEKESKERKAELTTSERRLQSREDKLENKEKELKDQEKEVENIKASLETLKSEMEQSRDKHIEALEKAAALSKEDAKKELLAKLDKDLEREAAERIKTNEEKIKKESDKKSREILASSIQRCAGDHVVETTTSLVELPSDDMKGRIIGREGRNIRAFETATGVDLIVDDTPEAVILSSFNPLRREVARLTLKKLIADGRIHPARVEETYKKAEQEIKAAMLEYGEQAALDTNVQGLPAVMIQLLGRLHYRTSYGQNVLQHSIEMSHLAGNLAAELGVNVNLAKRAALLHDIGKAVDQEAEGTHVKLGVMLAKKAGESIEVLHAMEAHHGDVETRTIEAVIVQACDAISAARPGARRDSLEAYVKRLEKLETVAKSFSGVEKCFAIQAGREVRVMVEPDVIDDTMAVKLAHDIAKKIEAELEYPGEVRVTVVREIRASDIAR
ncbi:ribonuclease Y [candidate division WOR-1 bacterium RIFOXYB2_FULL_42_35]|uniref:Ribonuclease Y n=1 Tax=candidate division WOR-1 bacterium RIFOXYC2_FULL_41_25 TaxID=1802586 RepID=A0A1F4TSD8_UNCSA|nr:MAG: ribonuclease Y [candidate division WOR-1 bacterium RIFOXYA2_FULL_41_14]OGC25551.1 MAG: ribonuclease Y [candidate division WOR-1 bacterium RIFOXYB2_FULL_42_35]OGC34983.1 MAG: ribonuclease Y [candidate division WOR-1 bacterium RIFOXYC2_FULL_41_25]